MNKDKNYQDIIKTLEEKKSVKLVDTLILICERSMFIPCEISMENDTIRISYKKLGDKLIPSIIVNSDNTIDCVCDMNDENGHTTDIIKDCRITGIDDWFINQYVNGVSKLFKGLDDQRYYGNIVREFMDSAKLHGHRIPTTALAAMAGMMKNINRRVHDLDSGCYMQNSERIYFIRAVYKFPNLSKIYITVKNCNYINANFNVYSNYDYITDEINGKITNIASAISAINKYIEEREREDMI